MSTDWYLINNSPIYNSGFENDEFTQYISDGLNEILGENSPISSSVNIINSDLTIKKTIRAVVQNNVSDSVSKSKERHIISTIGDLSSGNYVFYQNKNWLITSGIGNNKVYEKAIMQECNWNLKWQNASGTILSAPCITDFKYSGEDENKVITLGADQKSVFVQANENTILFALKQRFFVDKHPTAPTPYEIISVDTTTYNGLVRLVVKQSTLKDSSIDRVDLGICDYLSPTENPETDSTYSVITSTGDLCIGTERTITAKAYNPDTTENTTVLLEWNVIFPTGLENYFTKIISGNTCKIRITDDDYVTFGLNVQISVSDGLGQYIGYKTMTITG